MTHMVSHGTQGNVQDTRINQLEAEKYNYVLFKILAENCGKTFEEMLESSRNDKWFNSDEALEFGLIDKIVGVEKNQSMSDMMHEHWIAHLTESQKGQALLSSLPVGTSYEIGVVSLALNFTPNFESILWKNKFNAPPYAPVRGSFPLASDGKHQKHPATDTLAVKEISLAAVLQEHFMQSKSISTGSKSTIYFSRVSGVNNVFVSSDPKKSLKWHLLQIKDRDLFQFKQLLFLPQHGFRLTFCVPLMFESGNMDISVESLDAILLETLFNDSNVKVPLCITIKEEIIQVFDSATVF